MQGKANVRIVPATQMEEELNNNYKNERSCSGTNIYKIGIVVRHDECKNSKVDNNKKNGR